MVWHPPLDARHVRLPTSDDRTFLRWGVAGYAASVAVALAVAASQGLSVGVQALLAVCAALTFLTVAWTTKVWTGRESLTYYHHEIAVLAVAAVVAHAAGAPVLAHLDVTAMGLGTFLAFGRIGCLRVGCCHGRPSRRGVRYGHAHVDAGFPAYLRDVRLVPVQAVESAAALLLVLTALLLVDAAHPGRALVVYVGAYAVVRFALEELRGDASRRYWRGLSEAQWTSLILVGAECLGAGTGLLPSGAFAVASALLLAVGCGVVALRRRLPVAPLDPRHVRELADVARALARREPTAGPIPVWETSAGVRISAGRAGERRHFTLSRAPHALSADEAARLARVVGEGELVAGPASTYHLLVAS